MKSFTTTVDGDGDDDDNGVITTNSQSKGLWDDIARQYTMKADEGEREAYEKFVQILHKEGILPGESSLLEAGCGSGQVSVLLAKEGYDVALLDFSDIALTKSKEIFKQHNLKAEFILSDLFEMSPKKTGKYDVVWNSGVLEHFDGWQVIRALEIMAQMANKLVIFLVPNLQSRYYVQFRQKALEENSWQWGLEILRDKMDDLVEYAGLQIVSQHYTGEFHTEYFMKYVNKVFQEGESWGEGDGDDDDDSSKEAQDDGTTSVTNDGGGTSNGHVEGGAADRDTDDADGKTRQAIISDKDKYLKIIVAKPVPTKMDNKKKIDMLLQIFRDDSAALRNTYYADTSIMAKELAFERESIHLMDQKLHNDKLKLSEQITRLNHNMYDEVKRSNLLREEIRDAKLKIESHTTKIKELRGIKNQRDEMASKVTKLTKDLSYERDTNKLLRQDLQDAHDKLGSQITELIQKLAYERDTNKLLRQDLQDAHDKLGSQITELKQGLALEKARADNLGSQITELKQGLALEKARADNLVQDLSFERERVRLILDSKTWKLTRLYDTKFGGTITGRLIEKVVNSITHNVDAPIPDLIPTAVEEPHQQPPQQQDKQQDKASKQIDKILKENPDTKGVIIYPPTVDWNIPLLQRPQHMALHMAKNNWLYFYCTTNTYDNVKGFERLTDRLYLTDKYGELLTHLEKYTIFVHSAHPTFKISDIKALERKGTIIYDYLDEIHPSISGIRSEDVRARHMYMIKNSKAVLVTAKKLYNEVVKVRQDGVYLLPNAVEYSHFHKKPDSGDIPKKIKSIRNVAKNGGDNDGTHPIIGYFGAIANWFDYELVAHVAKKHPDWQMVLIGWDYDGSLDKSAIRKLPNVHYLGVLKYDVLPNYACWFDVCMLPFLLNDITHATSPIKLFEYMALGKPIVTTAISEAANYESCIISNSDDFAEKIRKALDLRDDAQYLSLLDKEAKENTWKMRFMQVDKLLQDMAATGAGTDTSHNKHDSAKKG